MILNEYDVAFALERASAPTTNDRPNLLKGAAILARLVEWTNQNSDGWPYWVKPRNASRALQEHVKARTVGLTHVHARITVDISDEGLKNLVRPIKAFLTRQNVDPDVKRHILGEVA